MTLVSYAQNYEDIMLWRALQHVSGGFYVDVGAHDPIHGSVSRLFYEQGWRGIHVEPTPQYSQMLMANRPDERVVVAAIGDVPGEVEITIFPDTGLTTAAPKATEKFIDTSQFAKHLITVPQITLEQLLSPYRGQAIHWLKIDIEGYEEQALKGWNGQIDRPWIMVLEATYPGSQTPYFEHWEPLILAFNYQFVYFDGLNRFYVAQEHAELISAFSTPPNFFDNFVVYSQIISGQNSAQKKLSYKIESLQFYLRQEIATKWQWVDALTTSIQPSSMLSCPLCGHGDKRQNFCTLETTCTFGGGHLCRYVCPHCQVIFGPEKMLQLSPSQLNQEYNHHYQVYQEGDSTASEVRAFFALEPQKDKRYLNFGAGAWSKTVAYLRGLGWDVWAYEPHSSATPHDEMHEYTLSCDDILDQHFDGIFTNNVLEHFREPIAELSAMNSLLKPNGRLAHATPCYEYRYEYTRFHLFFFQGRSRSLLWNAAGVQEIAFIQDQDFMCAVCQPWPPL